MSESQVLEIFKKIIKNAKKDEDGWEEEHIQKILILCIESFNFSSEQQIFKLINDVKMFEASLLSTLLDNDLVDVETTWQSICQLINKGEQQFSSMIASAVDNDIPIYSNEFGDINVITQVYMCKYMCHLPLIVYF